jgi:hypothetical protein
MLNRQVGLPFELAIGSPGDASLAWISSRYTLISINSSEVRKVSIATGIKAPGRRIRRMRIKVNMEDSILTIPILVFIK